MEIVNNKANSAIRAFFIEDFKELTRFKIQKLNIIQIVYYKLHSHYFSDICINLAERLDQYTLSSVLCEKCCEFSSYLSQYDKLYLEDITQAWSKLFSAIYVRLGGKYSESTFLFNHMFRTGNWSHLHETEEEKQRTLKECVDDFRSDVFYCSDRWSFDRLARCHWAYLNLLYHEKSCKEFL